MTRLSSPTTRFALAAAFSLSAALSAAHASGAIGGATESQTVSAPPLNKHPNPRDDRDVVKTYGVAALSYSFLVKEAEKDYPGYDFVFAGASSGPGSHFTPIDESAFEISVYQPWVVNSPDIVSNGGTTYNRNVTNQDAGGVNILIDYIPTGSDPTQVNFVQAYEYRENADKPYIAMDTCGADVPYYNKACAAGTDSNDNATVPLDASNVEAWILDTPYICESGRANSGCPASTPETEEGITTYTDYFQTWIEATGTYEGVDYNVLWAGFSWGFDFSATDVPEASTWAMLALGFAALGPLGWRRAQRARPTELTSGAPL